MPAKRRQIEVFTLSFLDVICCGFGAIILLLVITMKLEPATLDQIHADLSGDIERVDQERSAVVVQSRELQVQLGLKQTAIREISAALESLERDVQEVESDSQATILAEQQELKEELETVQQSLTEEMRNLLSQQTYESPDDDAVIGGIPVDSEYVIFVIDTSGSMLRAAWPLVITKVEEVLSIYPNVKGLQVISDNRGYMFPEYAGRWIPDTPARRRSVIRMLHGRWPWQTPSNSSPVEGVTHALRIKAAKGARVSVYVFGDDFDPGAGGSIDLVLREVERINKPDRDGNTRVRIHTFGFPVYYKYDEEDVGRRMRFAHLMRRLAEQNSGSFVGLTDDMK